MLTFEYWQLSLKLLVAKYSTSQLYFCLIILGSDGSQAAGISVVRVGHEGRPDDATDSENEDDKVPHVTLSVDSYYNEPDSIIKYGRLL